MDTVWYGKYWVKTQGNGLTAEIGRRGTEETAFMQGDEAADFLTALDAAQQDFGVQAAAGVCELYLD